MNKDEILKMSRKENENQDEMERDAMARAGQRACAVGGLICVLIILLEHIFSDFITLSTWAVYLSMRGTMHIVKHAKLKKKDELIFALIDLALAAACFTIYVFRLVRQ